MSLCEFVHVCTCVFRPVEAKQGSVLDLLELELQTFVSHLIGVLGT